LLGTCLKEDGPTFAAWDEEDSLVMSWLLNFMVPEISDTVVFLTTTNDIWEAINLTYSKIKDVAQIYEIWARVTATKQGSKTITEYANMLQTLW